jgi:hypothetical protein
LSDVDPKKITTYALTYREAHGIAEMKGWTKTPSWAKGGYAVTHPGKDLIEILEPYRMTKEKWWEKVTSLQGT